jgi:aminopeptidase N
MKKHFLYFAIILLCFFGFDASAQQPVCRESLAEQESANQSSLATFAEHNTPEFSYDVTYYRTYWELNPDTFYIKGSVTTYYKPTSANFNKIGFDMNGDLTVDSVIYHNSKAGYTVDKQNDELLISFSNAAPKGIMDSVTVYYKGIPYNNSGSISQNYHHNVADIWTLSEPYGAEDWWPCKQSLMDKADSIDIYVKTTVGNLVASNGLLVGSVKHDSSITYHWKHRYPIATYLVGVAVTNYAQYNLYAHVGPNPGDSLLILNYLYPEDSAIFYKQSLLARNAMELYVKLFGRYPFDMEKYGQAEFDFGGGMEHQTMSFVRSMEFSLISHEMAHHWFGDKVTCGSWKDIWLNEGFAVFCEGQAEKYIMGDAAWQNWINTNLGEALQQTSGSVYVEDTTSSSRIFSSGLTYSKGGYVLRMLEFMMGDSAFFSGCRSYLSDKGLAYFFANTSDLQNHFEAASGLKLDSFFKEWIYGQGFPQFNIYWKQADNILNVHLVQNTTNASVPFFHIPVPITIKMGNKDSSFNLTATSSSQYFNIPISAKVDSLISDPDKWLIASYTVFPLDSLPGIPIYLYPNPTGGEIILNTHQGNEDNGEVIIYNINGKQVYDRFIAGNKPVDIDVSSFANGMYFLKYVGKSTILQEKFVKL